MNPTDYTKFQSRKWILALLNLIVIVGLRVFDMIDGGQAVTLLGWNMGLYSAANVAQKVFFKNDGSMTVE